MELLNIFSNIGNVGPTMIHALSAPVKIGAALLSASAPLLNDLMFMDLVCRSIDTPLAMQDREKSFPNVKVMQGADLIVEYEQHQKLIEHYRKNLTELLPLLQSGKLNEEGKKKFQLQLNIAQGLIKRNEIIIRHCKAMLDENNPGYRQEAELLQNPDIQNPKTRAKLRELLEQNRDCYAKIRQNANRNQKLVQEQSLLLQTIANQSKQYFGAGPDKTTDLASRMGAAKENVRSLTASQNEPASGGPTYAADARPKQEIRQFKPDANVMKTMTTQLTLDEKSIRNFIDDIEKTQPKVVIASDSTGKMKISSADSVALCKSAQKLADRCTEAIVFDIHSPSDLAAFKIVQEAQKSGLKIGTVTFMNDKKQSVTLDSQEKIDAFIRDQKVKSKPSESSPGSAPESSPGSSSESSPRSAPESSPGSPPKSSPRSTPESSPGSSSESAPGSSPESLDPNKPGNPPRFK